MVGICLNGTCFEVPSFLFNVLCVQAFDAPHVVVGHKPQTEDREDGDKSANDVAFEVGSQHGCW